MKETILCGDDKLIYDHENGEVEYIRGGKSRLFQDIAHFTNWWRMRGDQGFQKEVELFLAQVNNQSEVLC